MKSTRLRAYVLLAAAAWTLYVWGTRIWNIVADPEHTFGFKAVHSLLAAVSIAFAVALAVIGWRMHRESRNQDRSVSASR
jgi:cytochrome bd-type quinol oxidase subunit 1